MLSLLLLSFVAGILTVAAPCVLPLLPVIVGGSMVRSDADAARPSRTWLRPLVIALSLAGSVIIFTLLLKATTALLGVPQFVWQVIAGGIVLIFGLTMLFPQIWEKVMSATRLQSRANSAMDRSYRRGGVGGDILLGAALGPTFSSCSPTYALILAVVLPVSFAEGVTYIVVYSLGLGATLFLIGLLGRAFVTKLGWLANPSGWLRKTIGVLLVLVGLGVIFGLDKQFQTFVLESGWYDPIADFEQSVTG